MPVMKIDQWMKVKGVSKKDLSVLLKRHLSRIGLHLNHGTPLGHEAIRRLYFITHGAVQPNDFFDLENCPEDLREHYYGRKEGE